VKLVKMLLLLFLAVLVAEWQSFGDSMSAGEVLRFLRADHATVLEGATLSLVLETAISSATSRSGDLVVARLAEDIRVGDEVVVPAGTEVRGLVTAVLASGRAGGHARVAFDFDRLVLRNQEHSIGTRPVDITAASHEGDAVIGMGVGTGVVLTNEDREVELDTGTVVTVRLTRETRL
jgi:hypothetical protein